MNRTFLLLLGVFVGGAVPWLEAIVVIPPGIVAGLHPVPAVIAGVSGNLLTVALAAWFGDRIRRWWQSRRAAKRAGIDEPDGDVGGVRSKRASRAGRVARRWGLPALALIGPIGLGTQVSAMVAVGIGIEPRRAFVWVGAGTLAWSIVAAIAAVTGMSITGLG